MATISVKAKYKTQLRRLRIDSNCTLKQLLESLSNVFQTVFSTETHTFKYVDDEKDEITLEEEDEWQEAVRVTSDCGCLKFFILDQKKAKKKKTSTITSIPKEETKNEVISDVTECLTQLGEEVEKLIQPIREFTAEIIIPHQTLTIFSGAPKSTVPVIEEKVEEKPVEPVVVQKPVEKQTTTVVQPEPQKVPAHMEQSWTFVEVNSKEVGPSSSDVPASAFVKDLSIPDTTKVQVGSIFTKTWVIKNTGSAEWPEGTTLQYISGPKDVILSMNVPAAKRDQEVAVSVTVKTPDQPGKHKGYFKLMTPNKVAFGHTFWFEIEAIPKQAPVLVNRPPVQFPQYQVNQPLPNNQPPFRPMYPNPQPMQPFRQPVQQFVQQPTVQPVQQLVTPTQPQQSNKWDMQLRLLSEMGFDNKTALIPLLEKHNGDLTAVVHAYISL